MIQKWEIRENTLTDNSVYLLVVEGTDADAALLEKNLSGFASLIGAKAPGYTHVLELSGITDDDMLEKIRVRIESLISQSSNEAFHSLPDAAKTQIAPANELPQNLGPKIPRALKDVEPAADTAILNRPDTPQMLSPQYKAERTPEEREAEASILRIIEGKEAPSRTSLSSQGAVKLARSGKDLSLKSPDLLYKENDIQIDNDLDVGDGTFINLGSEQVKEIKDLSGYNNKSVLDQKSPGEPQKQSPQLMPLGGKPAMQRQSAPPAKQQPLKAQPAQTPAQAAPQPAPQAAPPKAQGKSLKAAAVSAAAQKAREKTGSLFANLFSKLMAFKSAAKEKLTAPTKPPAQEAAPAKEAETQPAPNPAPAEQPPAARQAAPKSGVVVESAGNKTPFKSARKAASAQKETPGALKQNIFQEEEEEAFSGQMPVDDIFAAETILNFYADMPALESPNTGREQMSQILGQTPPPKKETPAPKPAPQAAPAPKPAPRPAPAFDPFLEVPENLLSPAAQPKPAAAAAAPVAEPAPAPQSAPIIKPVSAPPQAAPVPAQSAPVANPAPAPQSAPKPAAAAAPSPANIAPQVKKTPGNQTLAEEIFSAPPVAEEKASFSEMFMQGSATIIKTAPAAQPAQPVKQQTPQPANPQPKPPAAPSPAKAVPPPAQDAGWLTSGLSAPRAAAPKQQAPEQRQPAAPKPPPPPRPSPAAKQNLSKPTVAPKQQPPEEEPETDRAQKQANP
ncbi:MAG: hypothetical protein LBR90_02215 [Elusimicrobiota bacterium]|jgi:hypothetical protein|nr:hypothetical protein [Elusimicrobiota bacterium]